MLIHSFPSSTYSVLLVTRGFLDDLLARNLQFHIGLWAYVYFTLEWHNLCV